MEGISSVFPNPKLQLYTTRSWDFMGLTDNSTRNPTIESDTIIGMLDSGVWPESESFSDKGISLVPKKWKGTCTGGTNFTCNRYSSHFSCNNDARIKHFFPFMLAHIKDSHCRKRLVLYLVFIFSAER